MDERALNGEVGVMKLQVFYEVIDELLNTPEEERDTYWAYKICQQTRFAVMKILECFPETSEVQRLLKTYKDLPEKVKDAKDIGPYEGHLGDFASSMQNRLEEMHNYVVDMSAPPEPPEIKKTNWKTKLLNGFTNLHCKRCQKPTATARHDSVP